MLTVSPPCLPCRTRAVNVAFPLLTSEDEAIPASTVLAQWLFIPPTKAAIDHVGAYLQEHLGEQWPDGLTRPSLFGKDGKVQRRGDPALSSTLPLKHMVAISNQFKKLGVKLLMQRAGDIVHVLPGYIHAVYNLVPCIKLAYDFVASEDVVNTAVSMFEIASGVFGQRMADDYSDVGSRIAEFLDQAYISELVASPSE